MAWPSLPRERCRHRRIGILSPLSPFQTKRQQTMKPLPLIAIVLITLIPLTITAFASEIPTLNDNQALESPAPIPAERLAKKIGILTSSAEREEVANEPEGPALNKPTDTPVETEVSAPFSRVTEQVIASAVIDREPVEPGTRFPADTPRLFCHSRIASTGTTTITHIWYRNGEPVAKVPLEIEAASAWRTWSSKAIFPATAAAWKVEIIAADGTLLSQTEFTVE